MRLSVIIPARNVESVLGWCIAALVDQLAEFEGSELIVVDDRSTDRTAAVARRAGACVIEADGRGPAAARNLGARHARGEILVFVDADCVPQPRCLRALLQPFVDPGVVGVRGGYTSRQRSLIARFVQLELDEKQGHLSRTSQVTVVDTVCAAYRASAFVALGGFDESFPACSAEDVELSFRVTAAGGHLAFAPNAVVEHRHTEHLGRYLWRKARFGFYRARLYRMYPRRVQHDGYTPGLMRVQIALAGLLLASGAAALVWSVLTSVLTLLLCLFVAASVPLMLRASASSGVLAAWVPMLLLVRSLAQVLGLVAGCVAVVATAARESALVCTVARRAFTDGRGASQ